MDNQNRKLELLGNAPIPKALLAMGLPTMIGMLINALYNLLDAYFVGGLGESQMAAISVVYPLGQVVVGLGLLFGNGAASYISRLLGQRNKDQANKVASTALYSSLVVGAIMIPCSWKRKRRVYSWSLPTRYLLHSRYLNFSIYMGIKRYFICTADCRCSLCTYYSIYGNPFA